MKINGGTCGAINGGRLDRKKETSNCQAEEFWVGIVYSLAANMIQEVSTTSILQLILYKIISWEMRYLLNYLICFFLFHFHKNITFSI